MVQEYDAISTPGLVYYSLKPTTVSKEIVEENNGKDVYVEKHQEDSVRIIENPIQFFNEEYISISCNMDIELNTEDGYFKTTNKNIKIKQRTSSKVIFSIPFGIKEVAVEIKEKGDIITKQYRTV